MSSLPISTENLVCYYDTISSANGTIDRFFFLVAHLNLKPWKIRIILSLSREDISVFLEHRLYFRGVPWSFKPQVEKVYGICFVYFFIYFIFAAQRILCGTSKIKKREKKQVHCILQRKQEIKEETFAVGLLTWDNCYFCHWSHADGSSIRIRNIMGNSIGFLFK